jgi:hypothetical protein
MRRLRALEDLGYALGMMTGPKTPGRKPKAKKSELNAPHLRSSENLG